MRNNSYDRLTPDNGESNRIKVDQGERGLIQNHAARNGDRTRLACSFRRLAENIVPTIWIKGRGVYVLGKSHSINPIINSKFRAKRGILATPKVSKLSAPGCPIP